MTEPALRRVRTPDGEIAYEDRGEGAPVVLLHGFPYDVRAFDEVAALLAAAGRRVIVPYLRGFGPTRLHDTTPRSGQQGALGADLRALLDALGLERAVLAGYNWGGRAACVVAALWPERVAGLVTIGGYNIQDIAGAAAPLPPAQEHRLWYQFYLHGERGRAGLRANRREFCRLLWALWSPEWRFDDAIFEQTAPSFDNPDFVDVVVQSYRHRFGLAAGDPALDEVERRLAGQPAITVPTIILHGGADGVAPPADPDGERRHFTRLRRSEVIPGAGHNVPQERPARVAEAVLELP